MKTNDLLGRVVLAIPEQRIELGVSRRELADLSDVSYSTLWRLEHGRRVRPEHVLKVALALTALELYSEPKPEPADVLADLVPTLAVRQPMLALPPAPTLGGAA